jgi:predicted RNA-binding protein YlqC (UPF0109 family)
LHFIIENVVKDKDAIKIDKVDDELWTLLTLKVDKEDMWTIIGKWGATINAIRSLLRIYWVKQNKRINLKVLD